MPGVLQSVFENQLVAFIIVVGVVVFVHEFGHFLFARIFGIHVEEFALGFGPRAFSFRHGGTEYKLCWLPLGGYVRLYGSDFGAEIPLERRNQALSSAAVYKRVLISAAGPGMNLLLTFVVMFFLSILGFDKLPAQVSVVPGAVAERAGLPDGATILSINEFKVRTWEELSERISSNVGTAILVGYSVDGDIGKVTLTPAVSEDETVYGEKVKVGRIGVTPYFLSPRVVVRQGSVLAEAGVQTNDRVVKIGAHVIQHFHEIPRFLQKAMQQTMQQTPQQTPQQIILVIERGGIQKELIWNLPASLAQSEEIGGVFGIVSTDLMFASRKLLSTETGSPEQSTQVLQWQGCGLKSGVTLGFIESYGPVRSRVQIADWLERSERVLSERMAAGKTVEKFDARFRVIDATGRPALLICSVQPRLGRDHLNRHKLFLDFPVDFATHSHTAKPILFKSDSVSGAVDDGFKLTVDMGKSIGDSVFKLISGRIPFSNLGGPVEIARVAGTAAKVGWQAFVSMIAFISINVGILNLLPIPVLDGGTLFLLAVEAAYGKTLPAKVQEYVMRVGVFVILILVALVLYNDVLRRLAH